MISVFICWVESRAVLQIIQFLQIKGGVSDIRVCIITQDQNKQTPPSSVPSECPLQGEPPIS